MPSVTAPITTKPQQGDNETEKSIEQQIEDIIPGIGVSDALSSAARRPLTHPQNPVVFLDFAVGGHDMGRMKIELFAHIMPKCSENFRKFCTGEYTQNKVPIGYKGVSINKVIRGFMVQGGDFVKGNGLGSISIYGSSFPLEKGTVDIPHFRAGLLCMTNNANPKGASDNSEDITNGCQFFITCGACDWLDGRNNVFGQLLGRDSMQVLRKLEHVATDEGGKPRVSVTVTQCGEL